MSEVDNQRSWPWLQGCPSESRGRQVCSRPKEALNMNEAALRVAAYRLRHPYGELPRHEIKLAPDPNSRR